MGCGPRRTCPGKEDTFVLDFVNKPEEIYEAFKPYYEVTHRGEEADPRQLYDLQSKLDERHIYHVSEIEEFCKVFFKAKATQTPTDHAKINAPPHQNLWVNSGSGRAPRL